MTKPFDPLIPLLEAEMRPQNPYLLHCTSFRFVHMVTPLRRRSRLASFTHVTLFFGVADTVTTHPFPLIFQCPPLVSTQVSPSSSHSLMRCRMSFSDDLPIVPPLMVRGGPKPSPRLP